MPKDIGLKFKLQLRHSGSIYYFDIDVGLQASKDGNFQGALFSKWNVYYSNLRTIFDVLLTKAIHYRPLFAPLHFARHTIVISIHLHTRTIAQEKCGFFARVHLRAIGSAITGVGVR